MKVRGDGSVDATVRPAPVEAKANIPGATVYEPSIIQGTAPSTRLNFRGATVDGDGDRWALRLAFHNLGDPGDFEAYLVNHSEAAGGFTPIQLGWSNHSDPRKRVTAAIPASVFCGFLKRRMHGGEALTQFNPVAPGFPDRHVHDAIVAAELCLEVRVVEPDTGDWNEQRVKVSIGLLGAPRVESRC